MLSIFYGNLAQVILVIVGGKFKRVYGVSVIFVTVFFVVSVKVLVMRKFCCAASDNDYKCNKLLID